MNTHLLVRLTALADAREQVAGHKTQLDTLRSQFEAEHADLFANLRTAAALVVEAERDVRAMAEAEYRATGEKKPAPGVAIREKTSLVYDDNDAFAWAKQTNLALVPLSLDKKAFEQIAKATTLPFVSTLVEPQVTIATDLAAALAEVAA